MKGLVKPLGFKEPLFGRICLAISEHDKVQDALGNSVCSARSFSHFETGVNYIDRVDAEQKQRKLDLQRTSILWCF